MSIELQLTADTRPPSPEKLGLLCPPPIIANCPDSVRGWTSERNVALALRQLPFVQAVYGTIKDSADDFMKTDLKVVLNPEFGYRLEVVNVQVKSNAVANFEFNRRLGQELRRRGEPCSPQDRIQWRRDHHLVVINGGLRGRKKPRTLVASPQFIQQSFLRQHAELEDYQASTASEIVYT